MSQLFDLGPTRAIRDEERSDASISFGDFARANYEEAHKVSNFAAMTAQIEKGYDSVNDRIKAAIGEDLENPHRTGTFQTYFGRDTPWSPDGAIEAWRKRIGELKAKAPDALPWDDLIDEPQRTTGETMRKVRADQEEAMIRRGMVDKSHLGVVGKVPLVGAGVALGINAVRDPAGVAAQFGGTIAGQFSMTGWKFDSPVDVAANLLPFGAGKAGWSLIKNALANAAANAAIQSVLSTGKQADYKAAGLPYGWKVWLEEVEGAAATGFALDLGIRGPGRAAVRRYGRDTPSDTLFSRNTERGGFLRDAPEPVKPQISPETFQKAQEGDIAAAREIAEKTGAIHDPAIKGAFDYLEGAGKLTDDALAELEKMGIVRPDGFRILADAIEGRAPRAPEPVRVATEPLVRDEGMALIRERAAEMDALMREASPLLQGGHPRLAQFIEDAVEGGVSRYVGMVREALDGVKAGRDAAEEARALVAKVQEIARADPERFAAEIELRTGTDPLAIADSVRRFPDLVDTNTALDSEPVRMGRAIASLDDAAFAKVQQGAVPPQVAALVADGVPALHQARVIDDLARAKPETLAEAKGLIDELVPEARTEAVPLDGGGTRVDDPNAQVETLRQEAGRAYEDAMAPVVARQELESKVETIRGEIAKLEQEPVGNAAALLQKRIEFADAEARMNEAKGQLLAAMEGRPQPKPLGATFRRSIEKLVESGRVYRVADDLVNEQISAASRFSAAIPDGTGIGALARIEPTGRKGAVRAVFRLSDETEFAQDVVFSDLATARAIYLPEGNHIVFPALSRRDFEGSGSGHGGDSSVAIGVYHESVHARWRGLDPVVRDRLVAHAEILGVMDMQLGTFLRAIDNPTWRNALDGETLRELYSSRYAGRGDFQDIMSQEAVAHMQELHYAGHLSNAEVAPVLNDLVKMRGGAPARAVADAVGEPAFAVRGGLDMSPEARKARAEAMGFDTSKVYYKGHYPYSSGGPITNYKGEIIGDDGPYVVKDQLSGFFSENPEVANRFTGLGGWFDNGAVAPVYLKFSNPLEIDARGKHAAAVQFDAIAKRDGMMDELGQFRSAFDNGYDAVIIRNTKDEGDVIRIPTPQQVRSVNAEFDPAQSASPNLMFALRADIDTGRSMRRDLDALGYYSQALEAAKSWNQKKGTPEQALMWLKKSGVKDAEIEATGLYGFLSMKGSSVTRDDLVAHLEGSRVGLTEVRGGAYQKVDAIPAEVMRDLRELDNLGFETAREAWRAIREEPDWARQWDVDPARGGADARLFQYMQEKPPYTADVSRAAKWQSYSLDPDNPTYRETVLHLPGNEGRLAEINRRLDELVDPVNDLRTRPADHLSKAEMDEYDRLVAERDALRAERTQIASDNFQSGHFPEPNIIGHMMTSMTTHQGKPVYTVDQIQSDWGQKLRDNGARDEVKIAGLRKRVDELKAKHEDMHTSVPRDPNGRVAEEHIDEFDKTLNDFRLAQAELHTAEAATSGNPLVNTTDQWVNTTLRRAIRQAAEANAQYIAIPSGETVLSYNPGDDHGMGEFYGKIVPKNLRNLLGKIDRNSPDPQRIDTLDSPSGKTNLGKGFTLFPITDKVKSSVMTEGQPLFALRSTPSDRLDMSPEARKARAEAMGFDTSDVVYRGLTRPYESDKTQYYQMFTSNPWEAGEYAMANPTARPNVVPAYIRKGRNLAIDAGGKAFNRIFLHGSKLPEDMRNKLDSVTTIDEIAHAARLAGYDTVTVRNVIDNATNEVISPAKPSSKMSDAELDAILAELGDIEIEAQPQKIAEGYTGVPPEKRGPVTVNVVFDPANIRSVNADFDPRKSDSPQLLAALKAPPEPPIKADIAFVDRLNQIKDLVEACRA